jgi:hypothetical protein
MVRVSSHPQLTSLRRVRVSYRPTFKKVGHKVIMFHTGGRRRHVREASERHRASPGADGAGGAGAPLLTRLPRRRAGRTQGKIAEHISPEQDRKRGERDAVGMIRYRGDCGHVHPFVTAMMVFFPAGWWICHRPCWYRTRAWVLGSLLPSCRLHCNVRPAGLAFFATPKIYSPSMPTPPASRVPIAVCVSVHAPCRSAGGDESTLDLSHELSGLTQVDGQAGAPRRAPPPRAPPATAGALVDVTRIAPPCRPRAQRPAKQRRLWRRGDAAPLRSAGRRLSIRLSQGLGAMSPPSFGGLSMLGWRPNSAGGGAACGSMGGRRGGRWRSEQQVDPRGPRGGRHVGGLAAPRGELVADPSWGGFASCGGVKCGKVSCKFTHQSTVPSARATRATQPGPSTYLLAFAWRVVR